MKTFRFFLFGIAICFAFSCKVEETKNSVPKVTEITIVQQPTKITYSVNSKISFSGLLVAARYNNGVIGLVYDYTTDVEEGTSFENAGTYTVTVSYKGFDASFDITVAEQVVSDDVYLEAISVFQKPVKITYEQHQTLDLSGLIVLGTYSNGVNSLFLDYTTEPTNGALLDELGSQIVKISRGSLSAEFSIEVVEEIIYGDVANITVSVAQESDVSIIQEKIDGAVKLTASDAALTYRWCIDGNLVGVEKEFTFNTQEKVSGNYEIFLVTKDSEGNIKSATIYIQVE